MSSSGDTTVNWTAGTFTEPVRVDVTDESSVGGTFGLGSRVVRVTVTRFSDGTALQTFDQPLELVFDSGTCGRALVLGGRRRVDAGAQARLRHAAGRPAGRLLRRHERAPSTC